MFKELKETIPKRLMENMIMISHQIETTHETEIIKRTPTRILELKSTITEMTSSLGGFNS